MRRFLSFMLVFSLVGSLASFASGAEVLSEVATAEATPQVYHMETYFQEPDTNATKDWPTGPLVEARAAILMDLDTDAILYAKNVDQQLYPASI
ncbi:MAG: D-alanyl-D-alanine carboxypeptidase, partial [Blautia sp.]|nr:D-alanyl-D-alanine carboxypeptidase [Blautia sp.]